MCSARNLVPAAAAAATAMRLLPGASASRISSPLLSLPRARPRCVPASSSACRAASSSAAGAGDGGARKPWLFVGLGNPGKVYQGTRHNVSRLPTPVRRRYHFARWDCGFFLVTMGHRVGKCLSCTARKQDLTLEDTCIGI